MESDLQQVAQALHDATSLRFDLAMCAARNSHYAHLDVAWGCVIGVVAVALWVLCAFACKIWKQRDRELFQPLTAILAFTGTGLCAGLFNLAWGRLNYPEIYIYHDMCRALLGVN